MDRDEVKLKRMRDGAKIAVNIYRKVLDKIEPGISTLELDAYAEALCKKENVKPAFKGYQDFPNVLCVGPNDTVVHGIPNDTPLESGDIISVDFGIIYKEVYLDMARTVGVGNISLEAQEFIDTVERSLEEACKQAIPGNTIGDIGYAIQHTVEPEGYSVVREMVGHGLGYDLHEDPAIPGYGRKKSGPELHDGQTIAIESIINQGSNVISTSQKDGWTTRTNDGKLSALFENTVIVSENPEILTPI